ncbi:hypothetical protein F6U93_06925 [Tamlana haliotis]|uniref:Lipocalin-like domain-containing protein n=1 Tax=Pseudotamlana haliotis TaxID=2614804 RepID=A0A6N6MJT1_9FLAO|nr:lipocalin family protein [Tamlana haliotis]KAB1068428.1 hypothetical protein F6U93_06925 [Tamlana haliotis]
MTQKVQLSFAFLALILAFNCSKNNDADIETSILGSWQETGGYTSAGGPQFYVEDENGETITFSEDGSFTSNAYPECSTGTYTLNENDLKLTYDCEDFTSQFQNPEGDVTYKITFKPGYFLLESTVLICTDGCSSKYIKLP